MALNKVNYVDNQTIITAQNLNDIQNEIIQNTELIKKAAPRNLLDNSDFRNPVNQRGFKGSDNNDWSYCIDRWIFNNSAWVDSGTLWIGPNATIVQRIDPNIVNSSKVYTAIVYTSEGVKFANINFNINPPEFYFTNTYDFGIFIYQAALYEGSYTAETLPEYQPKGYGAELSECQRYYLALNGVTSLAFPDGTEIIRMPINLPVTMRITPSITEFQLGWVMWTNNGYYQSDGTEAAFIFDGSVGAIAVKINVGGAAITNMGANRPVFALVNRLELSADL